MERNGELLVLDLSTLSSEAQDRVLQEPDKTGRDGHVSGAGAFDWLLKKDVPEGFQKPCCFYAQQYNAVFTHPKCLSVAFACFRGVPRWFRTNSHNWAK